MSMPNRITIRLVVVTFLLFTNAPADDRIRSKSCSSEPIAPDSSDNTWLQPLIHLDSSELEPFQWNPQASAILIDYAQKQEQLAQYFIDCGDWECLVKQCRSTKTAQDALEKLNKAGLKVLEDGRIISKSVFVSVVPITR